MLDYPIRVDAAKKYCAGCLTQSRCWVGWPWARIVPQVRVFFLDANLGSLTLTTGITSSLDPAGCPTHSRFSNEWGTRLRRSQKRTFPHSEAWFARTNEP